MTPDLVITAHIKIGGSEFHIALAEPALFAEWASKILAHYAGGLRFGGATVVTSYVGPWPE